MTVLSENDDYNGAFPQERYAHVIVRLKNGQEHISERHQAEGDPDTPLSEVQIIEKFHDLADPVLGKKRAEEIRNMIERIETLPDISELVELLAPPA